MRYDGAYKTYKLYSVTEQDIAVTGGNGASRYINNTVLVFLPDIEKPEIGTELLATSSLDTAKAFIDDYTKEDRTAQEIFNAAIQKSKEQEQQRQTQNAAVTLEEERRRKEQREEENIREQGWNM